MKCYKIYMDATIIISYHYHYRHSAKRFSGSFGPLDPQLHSHLNTFPFPFLFFNSLLPYSILHASYYILFYILHIRSSHRSHTPPPLLLLQPARISTNHPIPSHPKNPNARYHAALPCALRPCSDPLTEFIFQCLGSPTVNYHY
jgi:hypothetical protein